MKNYTLPLILLLSLCYGCIKESLKECPPESGNVRINIYAEKFQTHSDAPTSDTEETIGRRIQNLKTYLYEENGRLIDSATVSSFEGSHYTFESPTLGFGNYRIEVIANGLHDLQGDPRNPGSLYIQYPGAAETEDYFAVSYPFTIDCNCTSDFNTKLRRLQGVVVCHFNNIPAETQAIEVNLNPVNSRKALQADYSNPIEVTRKIFLTPETSRRSLDIVVGCFPGNTGQNVTYTLRLFNAGNVAPDFERVISREVRIEPNDLVELVVSFNDNSFDFDIHIDRNWEDILEGGGILLR